MQEARDLLGRPALGGELQHLPLARSQPPGRVRGLRALFSIRAEELPGDAQTQPTSLRIELGEPVDRASLLAAILLRLERAYDRWLTGTPASG